MSSIEFIHVDKTIQTTKIVTNFNLKIPDAQFVSLLGPSGCGKTTCLRMLAGLEPNSSGQILINQKVVNDPMKNIFVAPEKRNIGMVFQSYAVWPHMNVFENVAFPLKMAKLSQIEIKTRVEEILEIVELQNHSLRAPHELSGGQQQRVALARGLVMKPQALLLDEPLSNLDTKLREKMRSDIKKIQQQFKLTMVYVTHDQHEAKTMSDLVVVMNQGQIIQAGTVQDVYENPAHEFVADFIR
jgi:iron(III) transport system ATP-binding protein